MDLQNESSICNFYNNAAAGGFGIKRTGDNRSNNNSFTDGVTSGAVNQ